MIVAVLGCEKIETATAFYTDVLGCKLRSSFSLSPDSIDPCHRTFEFGDGIFHLTSFPADQGTGKIAYIYIDTPAEVDEIYERVRHDPYIEISVPLGNQSWGMREFNFRDGGGNRICIGAQLDENAPNLPVEN